MSDTRRLALELHEIRQLALGHATNPQFGNSSVDGEGLSFRDGNGNEIGRIGGGENGMDVEYTYGPKPPMPSTPIVTADANLLLVQWDGQWADGNEDGDAVADPDLASQAGLDRVEVHVSMEPTFVPDPILSFAGVLPVTPEGGAHTVGPLAEAGDYYVVLMARGKDGQYSAPSQRVHVVTTVGLMENELFDLALRADEARESADGKNTVHYGEEPVAPEGGFSEGDLWFDTTEDPETGFRKNTPHLWDPSANDGEGGWVSAADSRVDAVRDAQDALREDVERIVTDGAGATTYWLPAKPNETTGPPPKEGDLWFDTSESGGNKLHRFTEGAWASASDQRTAALQDALGDFEGTVEQRFTDADGRIDGLRQSITDLDETTLPALRQDLDAAEGRLGEAERDITDAFGQIDAVPGQIDAARQAAEQAAQGYTDAQLSSEAADLAAAIAAAQATADEAMNAADGAIRTYYEPAAPTLATHPGLTLGDMWYDTVNEDAYRWNGSQWNIIQDSNVAVALAKAEEALAVADGKITTYRQDNKPSTGDLGDLWFDTDNNNAPYYCTSEDPVQWVLVRDEEIAAAELRAAQDAKDKADQALQDAQEDATGKMQQAREDAIAAAQQELDAVEGTLQSSIDAKRDITWSTSSPPAVYGGPVGSTWFKMSGNGSGAQVESQWRWNGDVWVSTILSSAVLAKIDIGAGTFGSLSGLRLEAGSIAADKVLVGAGRSIVPWSQVLAGATTDPHRNEDWYGEGTVSIAPADADAGVPRHLVHNRLSNDPGVMRRIMYFLPGPQQYGSLRGTDGFAVAGGEWRFHLTAYTHVSSMWANLMAIAYNAQGQWAAAKTGTSQNIWTTPKQVSLDITLPESAAYIVLYLQTDQPGEFHVVNPEFFQRTTGELIVDGTIQTAHLAADVLEVGNLKAGTGQIAELVSRKIAAATGQFLELDVGQLTVTEQTRLADVVAEQIAADTAQFMELEVGKLVASEGILDEAVIKQLFAEVVVSQMSFAESFIGGNAILEGSITAESGIIGSIDAGKITVGELDGARIKAKSVQADSVLINGSVGTTLIEGGAITTEKIAVGAITAESGIIGSLDAGVITTGELRGELIRAQSIAGEKLAVDAIDGKTITGATVRTSSAGARVEMNSTGLFVKNLLGTNTVSMTNGTLTMLGGTITGGTIRTHTSGARVQLDTGGLKAWNPSNEETFSLLADTGSVHMNGNFYSRIDPADSRVVIDNEIVSDRITRDQPAGQYIESANAGMMIGDADYNALFYTRIPDSGSNWSPGFRVVGPEERVNMRMSGYDSPSGGFVVSSDSAIGGVGTASLKVGGSGSSGAHFDAYAGNPLDSFGPQARIDMRGDAQRSSVNITALDNATSNERTQIRLRDGDVYTYASTKFTWVTPRIDWTNAPVAAGGTALTILSNGRIGKASSSRRYKVAEEPLEYTAPDISDRLLSVEPKTWYDRAEAEYHAEVFESQKLGVGINPDYLNAGPLRRQVGAIAEDLDEAGLGMLVSYTVDGEPESIMYDRFGPALIPVVRRLRDRVNELERMMGEMANA